MGEKIKHCKSCIEPFRWDDDVILVEDDIYHKDCVSLYPTGYFAMLDDEPLGETENEDGSMAFEIMEDDEYLEENE